MFVQLLNVKLLSIAVYDLFINLPNVNVWQLMLMDHTYLIWLFSQA